MKRFNVNTRTHGDMYDIDLFTMSRLPFIDAAILDAVASFYFDNQSQDFPISETENVRIEKVS